MVRRIFIPLMMAVLVSCSDAAGVGADGEAVDTLGVLVERVRDNNRLYCTEYTVHKVVTYDDIIRVNGTVFAQHFTFKLPQAQRKIIIPIDATLKAYIDFSGFSAENIKITGEGADRRIHLTLPEPRVELTSSKVDNHGVRQYIGVGRQRFDSAEMGEMERQGRAAVLAAVPDMGIVDDARRHAYNVLLPIIMSMGYEPQQVEITFDANFTAGDYADRIIQIPSPK